MRNITEIVIHHTLVTNQKQPSLEKQVSSMQNSHKERLPNIDEENVGSPTDYVQYHYVVGKDGRVIETRSHESEGWHAGNWNVNRRSIGICMTGNFDEEQPTQKQLEKVNEIIGGLKAKYGNLKVSFHRDYASKTCPGNNILKKHFECKINEDEKRLFLAIIKIAKLYWKKNAQFRHSAHQMANSAREILTIGGVDKEEII